MNKIAISLIALAALSTASFAGSPGDGADTDSPAVYNDYLPNGVPAVSKTSGDEAALSTGAVSATSDVNYINKSQLR